MASEPIAPEDRMAEFRKLIDVVAPIVPDAVLVSVTGPAINGNFTQAYETAIREYRKLAEYAGERGVRVALEPLNPITMNVDTFIGTLAEALEIIDAVDHPSFGMWLDVWHYWQDPEWPLDVSRCEGRIFGVHINDWRRPSAFGDRVTVGKGDMPLPTLLRAIHEAGYRGAYTAELFSDKSLPDSLWNGDLKQLVVDNKEGFDQVWRKAFSS
jgi:sugar phosphate isomerase/epimerase